MVGTFGTARVISPRVQSFGNTYEVLLECRGEQRDRWLRPVVRGERVCSIAITEPSAGSDMEIASARLLMLHTAWRIDRGEPAREGISMVKVQAAETLGRVADRAVQVFGGAGYCKDLPIERIYRDARIFRIYDGTSEIHRGIIARGLLARGVEAILPE